MISEVKSEFLEEISPSDLKGIFYVSTKLGNYFNRRIDPDALKVIKRLQHYRHEAFLVGGGVRDLLLGKTPKDFDIATDALPNQVRKIFRNSRIIGRRFKLNHVFFHSGKIIEVATFRDNSSEDETVTLGPDNQYGDLESDSLRRDLTINALYYDPYNSIIVDNVGGLKDFQSRVIRIIGDPDKRYKEDPIRIIRAIRHSIKSGFEIEDATLDYLKKDISFLEHVPGSRLFEEVLKDLRSGFAAEIFSSYDRFEILKSLFKHYSAQRFVNIAESLKRLDELANGGFVPPSFLAVSPFVMGGFVSESLLDTLSLEREKFQYVLKYFDNEKLSLENEGKLDDSEIRSKIKMILREALSPVFISKLEIDKLGSLIFARMVLLNYYFKDQQSEPSSEQVDLDEESKEQSLYLVLEDELTLNTLMLFLGLTANTELDVKLFEFVQSKLDSINLKNKRGKVSRNRNRKRKRRFSNDEGL